MTESASSTPASIPVSASASADVRGQRFIEFQYEDLKNRSKDPYAATKYAILAKWLPKGRQLEILNGGCGSGEFSFQLAGLGHRVDSIDPGAEYIDLARSSPGAAVYGDNCTFEVSDIASYRAAHPDRRYDVVVSTDVVEHIEDDVGTVATLCEMLKPGGDLLLTVPAGPYLFGYHDEQLGHYRRYTRKMARRTLPPGMQVQKVRYFGMSMIPVAWLYSVKLRRNYPVPQAEEGKRTPMLRRILDGVLASEKYVSPPLGTSCLMWARKSA